MSDVKARLIRWQVNRWGNAPSRREFVRETDKFFISLCNGGEVREAKNSRYHVYYETEDAALDAIAARQASKDEQKRVDRIRDAAPELLAALEWALDAYLQNDPGIAESEMWAAASAAIAKATGAQS
jgi:hypothetical protein